MADFRKMREGDTYMIGVLVAIVVAAGLLVNVFQLSRAEGLAITLVAVPGAALIHSWKKRRHR